MDPLDALDALRTLTSLDSAPRRARGSAAPPLPRFPWAEVADLAVLHGLAPLVAYTMEYRLAGGGAPEEVHDLLLGYYHGALTDNVYKLVQLRKLLAGAEEVPVLLLEGAAYADALYPHVAFRPLPELRLLVRRGDFQKLALAGQPLQMKPAAGPDGSSVLTDGRSVFVLHDALLGTSWGPAEEAMLARGVPAKAFGPRVARPAIEDALLTHVALLARAALAAPLVHYVDLRELVRGAPAQAGTWERAPDPAAVLAGAEAAGLTRALWCALRLVGHLFPEAEAAARPLAPALPPELCAVLEEGVVRPRLALRPGAAEAAGTDEVRRLLAG